MADDLSDQTICSSTSVKTAIVLHQQINKQWDNQPGIYMYSGF